MKIKFTNYDDGVHHFEFLKDIDDLELDNRFFGKLKVKCKLDKSHRQMIIDCDVSFNANLTCDRCITEFKRSYSEHFQNIYFIVYESGEASTDSSGIHYLTPKDDKIDLSEDVTEILKLSLPMKILCSDECEGLCPVCGKDLNKSECDCNTEVENPVWEKLKKLKSNLN